MNEILAIWDVITELEGDTNQHANLISNVKELSDV